MGGNMNIDELTLGQLKQIKSMCGGAKENFEHPYKIGQGYLIRTVTHYYTGQLDWVGDKELRLSNAAWIADTGRYHKAFESTDNLSEVEPIKGDAIIGRGAVIDAVEWMNNLPMAVK
jgi:hypothetical protein